jgi:spermidine synthase
VIHRIEEIVRIKSPKQSIFVGRHPEQGLVLLLDGAVQFAASTEAIYHEYLAVLPALFVRPKRVFIGGGGDGLAAARLLRFPEIREIRICDYDPRVTGIARSLEELRRLNFNSLSDPRVRIVHQDAFSYLDRASGTFDLILCDFPDPMSAAAARVFSREFYRIARRKLSPGGVMAVQATGLRRSFGLIRDSIRAVFPHVRACLARYADGQASHFVLAGKRPLRLIRSAPPWALALGSSGPVDWLADRRRSPRSKRETALEETGHLARITLLDRYRDTASAPYPFNRRYRAVHLGPGSPCPRPHLTGFVRALAGEQPLILYVPHPQRREYGRLLSDLGYVHRKSYRTMEYAFTPANRERLDFWWKKLDNGTVVSIDARYGRPDEDPEIAGLMERYLLEFGHRFLDLDVNHDVLGQSGLHLLARAPGGRAVVMMVLSSRFNIEIVYGRGSSRANLLGILLCLRYLERTYGQTLTFQSATSNIIGFMLRLGGTETDRLDVFTPSALM